MTASITLQSSITFHPSAPPVGAYWELALGVVASSNAPEKVLVMEAQRKRLGNSFAWGVPSFTRVASKADMGVLAYEEPDHSSVLLKNGYYRYLSSSLTQRFTSWDEANSSYTRTRGQILSLLGVGSTTEVAGELALRVVGLPLRRIPSVPHSMYPLDVVTFVGTGGSRPYTYSLEANVSGSTVDSATGMFTASCLVGTTVTVEVTDSAPSPAKATLLITLAVPANPPESEVLHV